MTAAQLWLPWALDRKVFVLSTDDRRRILDILLAFTTAIPGSARHRGQWVADTGSGRPPQDRRLTARTFPGPPLRGDVVPGQIPKHRVHSHVDESPIAPPRGGSGQAGLGSGLTERAKDRHSSTPDTDSVSSAWVVSSAMVCWVEALTARRR